MADTTQRNRRIVLLLGAGGIFLAAALLLTSVIIAVNQARLLNVGSSNRVSQEEVPDFLQGVEPEPGESGIAPDDALPPGLPPGAANQNPEGQLVPESSSPVATTRTGPVPLILSMVSVILAGGAFALSFMSYRR